MLLPYLSYNHQNTYNETCRLYSSNPYFISIKTIFISLTLIHFTISAITTSTSFLDFYPPQIQADQIILEIGKITDLNTTTVLTSVYTVILARVKDMGPYILTIGIKGAQLIFPQQPTPGQTYLISYKNVMPTQFQIQFYLTDETHWTFIRVNYITISKVIPNIYQFFKICAINADTTAATPFNFTYTDLTIPALTNSYFIVVSFFKFAQLQRKLGITSQFMKVTMVPQPTSSSTTYTISITSNGYYISQVGVQGLIIDSSLINNKQARNVILIKDYQYSGGTGTVSQIIYSQTGVPFFYTNLFFGLYHFDNVDQIDYYFYIYSTSQVQVTKYYQMNYLASYILLFYNNKCNDPFTYDTATQLCILCPDQCTSCNSTQCFHCSNGFSISADKSSCQCNYVVTTGICYDFNSGPLKGCLTAITNSTGITCKACSYPQYLKLNVSNQCSCKDGFQFDSNRVCIEVCGDGLKQKMACDDGNRFPGDGCSQNCTLQAGFQCKVTATQTLCKSDVFLTFDIVSIFKNEDNSAIITFEIITNLIPFPLNKQDFQTTTLGTKMFSIKLVMKDGSLYEIQSSLIQVKNNQLQFKSKYDFTIEGMDAKLYLNMTNSKYTMKQINYQFKTIGGNEPLKYASNVALFEGSKKGYFGVSTLFLVLLFVGLMAPKYIGLQAVLTLQLIFYSCLLVNDSAKYPAGFNTFAQLKLSSGYNGILSITSLILSQDIIVKYNFISIKKTIIENYRPQLKEQQKQGQYYKKYVQKPLYWLRQNEPKEYEQRLRQIQELRIQQNDRINIKNDDIQYQKVSLRLRKQFRHKKLINNRNKK